MITFNVVWSVIIIRGAWCFLNDEVYLVHQNFEELFIGDDNSTDRVYNNEEKPTPEELVRSYGYPFETHTVSTEDGYFLNLFRVPYGRRNGSGNVKNKKVVLIQHGILSSSVDWLTMGPQDGLGFILADENFDVWLGNFRGNGYSNKHKSLSSETDVDYWKFEFHEIALYDLPAMTDYILDVTKRDKIYYIGHSLANTIFYAMCSMKPEYNLKFHMEIALAPAVYISYDGGSIALRLMTNLFFFVHPIIKDTDIYDRLSMINILKIFSSYICVKIFDVTTCENIAFNCVGIDEDGMSAKQIADVLTFIISPFSLRIVPHFVQIIQTGEFKQYDHGWIKNLLIYKNVHPPKYDLSEASVPIYIYYGLNDFLVLKKDINRLSNVLPNVKLVEQIPDDDFGHGHFLWGKNTNEILYSRFIRIMKKHGLKETEGCCESFG